MSATDSPLSRPLVWVTRFAVRSPRQVLVAAGVLALLSLVLSARCLEFRTSRLDLLNSEMAYNQRWHRYLAEFGDRDDVVVVVESGDVSRVTRTLDELGNRLSAEKRVFSSVMYQPDFSALRAKSLNYLPLEQLQSIDRFLNQLAPVLKGDWASLNVLKQCQWMQELAASPRVRRVSWESGGADRVASVQPSEAMLSGDSGVRDAVVGQSPWTELSVALGRLTSRLETRFLLAEGGHCGFLLLRITTDEGDFVRGREAVARLREIIAQVKASHRDVRIGVTGMPVLEADEMAISQSDSTRSTLLGMAGVVLALVAGLGGWRGPALATVSLALGLTWTLGFTTMAVGHLNILSMSFGVILVGLGIDFGIHYFARYDHLATGCGTDVACESTARSVGPGIVSGAVTTALAFLASSLTQFKGVAELGVIAGGGILLCLLAVLVVFPALLRLCDRRSESTRRTGSLSVAAVCTPFLRYRKSTLALGVLLLCLAARGLPELRYDHNLLNLQPLGLESVELERRLSSGSDRSVWHALSMADSQAELARLKARFEALDVVSRTEEIASLVPQPDGEKSRLVKAIHERLDRLPASPPLIPVTPREDFLRAIRFLPAGFAGRSLLEQVSLLPDSVYYQRMSRVQQSSAGELLALLHTIRRISHPSPPQFADVPPELAERYVGRHGRHLLKVYGKGSLWDMDSLSRFVRGVEAVDPNVTGHPVQTYYASRHMQRSFVHAGIYALFAVVIALMLDFRSVRYTLLSMAPLAAGAVLLFGLLGLFDVPLNAANLIVLPLILGIGVDNGVHLVHDFIEQRDGYRLSNSTACAILLCSTTTIIGFGSMMISKHQGLQSLGLVLAIGVGCCLGTSLILFPPLLSLLRPPSQGAGDVIRY